MTTPEDLISTMNWRYGVKAFDPMRKVSDIDVEAILETMRLSPSSFGLQPWKFFVVESEEIRRRFAEAVPLNKAKFEDASHLIILARLNSLSQEYVDQYFDLVKMIRNQTDDDVKMFYDMLSSRAATMPDAALNTWTSKQVYIALGNGIMSAALLGIDASPMEGINPELFDEILGLSETEYSSTVALALGYRSAGDPVSKLPKVRFPKEHVTRVI